MIQLDTFYHNFVDTNGLPYVGGSLRFVNHSTGEKSTNIYQDEAGNYPRNPVLLDAEGKPATAIWFDETSGEVLNCIVYNSKGLPAYSFTKLDFVSQGSGEGKTPTATGDSLVDLSIGANSFSVNANGLHDEVNYIHSRIDSQNQKGIRVVNQQIRFG